MKNALQFLAKLKKNNNREWFEKHRDDFEIAKLEVADTVNLFIELFSKKDASIIGLTTKDCVFRIYRDVRFSKNKSPYKTNLGAYISPGGKKSINAGYYLHFEPGGSFIAGGMWMPAAEELRKIRQEIDYNGNDLKKILANKRFKATFGGLDPEHKLKTAPKNYAKDHPEIELLKHNSFICWHSFADDAVIAKDFPKKLTKSAELLMPFNAFLNTAIS